MDTRTPTRVFASVFAATLVLAGCSRATEQSSASTPPAESTQTASSQRWEAVSGAEGVALVLLAEGDRQIFHLACTTAPAQVQIIVSNASVIGSEERMTLGVADEAFGFVADTERTGPGVLATGAIDPAFLEHLARTTEISAVYGAQQIGPWPAPSQAQRDDFVASCSQIVTPLPAEPAASN